ncbi:MAG: hypothetical protein ABSD47_01230 [Candidatus Methylomirabilota bacterium]
MIRQVVVWAAILAAIVALSFLLGRRYERTSGLRAESALAAVTITKEQAGDIFGYRERIYHCPRAPREDLQLDRTARP